MISVGYGYRQFKLCTKSGTTITITNKEVLVNLDTARYVTVEQVTPQPVVLITYDLDNTILVASGIDKIDLTLKNLLRNQ